MRDFGKSAFWKCGILKSGISYPTRRWCLSIPSRIRNKNCSTEKWYLTFGNNVEFLDLSGNNIFENYISLHYLVSAYYSFGFSENNGLPVF